MSIWLHVTQISDKCICSPRYINLINRILANDMGSVLYAYLWIVHFMNLLLKINYCLLFSLCQNVVSKRNYETFYHCFRLKFLRLSIIIIIYNQLPQNGIVSFFNVTASFSKCYNQFLMVQSFFPKQYSQFSLNDSHLFQIDLISCLNFYSRLFQIDTVSQFKLMHSDVSNRYRGLFYYASCTIKYFRKLPKVICKM